MKAIQIIKNKMGFFLAFGFSKVLIIIIPIWLADILTKKEYGSVEFGLIGLGIIVSAVFSLGIPGAYPYFILKKKDFKTKNAFTIHPIWLITLLIINQLLYYVFNTYNFNIYFALNISYLVANQIYYSTKLKTKERISKAVLLGSGIYFLLLLFIVSVTLFKIKPKLIYINYGVLFYSLFYVGFAVYNILKVNKDNILIQYKKILQFSFHLLISSVLIVFITTFGVLLINYFFNIESVAVYGFYLRLATYMVILQRVISFIFFKKLYIINYKILDKYYALFFLGIFFLSIFYYLIAPYMFIYFSNFYGESFLENKKLFFILISQMLMWMASALNSVIVDRENLTKKNNPRFIVLIIISLIVVFLINNLTPVKIAIVHYIVFFLATLIQYYSLYKKRMLFKKSIITLVILFLISNFIIYFVI